MSEEGRKSHSEARKANWDRMAGKLARLQKAGVKVTRSDLLGVRSLPNRLLRDLHTRVAFRYSEAGEDVPSWTEFNPWFKHRPRQEELEATFGGLNEWTKIGARLFPTSLVTKRSGESDQEPTSPGAQSSPRFLQIQTLGSSSPEAPEGPTLEDILRDMGVVKG